MTETRPTHQQEMHAVERDWRIRILWTAAKVAFGALVVAGVNNIVGQLRNLENVVTQQQLDHQQLQALQRQSDQAVQTLKAYGLAIQINTDSLKAMNEKRRSTDQ